VLSLRGKVAVVTGAARGIGRACAIALARNGADLVLIDICHDLAGVQYPLGSTAQLAHTAELAASHDVVVSCVEADIRDPAAVRAAIDSTVDRFGQVDVVVNNAGIVAPSGKAVHHIEDDEWQLMLDVDLSGAWRLIRAVGAIMVQQRRGSIINVASTAGLVGYRNFAGYVTAKHALIGLTRAAALDLAPFGVRVNALCPGSVRDDPLLEGRMLMEIARSLQVPIADHEATFVAHQPMNVLVEAADVANAAVWLAGDESRHVTGGVLTIDGGYTTQ